MIKEYLLLEACRTGKIDEVKRLLQPRKFLFLKLKPLAWINYSLYPDRETPLFKAIDNRHTEIAKYLIENGADINYTRDHQLRTPLIAASLVGNYEIIKSLIAHGAKIDDYELYKINALHIAAQNNDISIAELLLSKGSDINAKSISDKKTPLHFANYDFAKFLILKGAIIDSEDGWGNTPLHYAYLKNDKSLIDLLIANGASSEIKNRKGITPKQVRIYEIPRVITILDMCPKCSSGKSGDISLNRWPEECFAGAFKCPYCGSIFSTITSNSTSISSLEIKWVAAEYNPLGYYKTSHCAKCNGLSFHKYVSTVQFRDEADDQSNYQGYCHICSGWNEKKALDFTQLLTELNALDASTRGIAALKSGIYIEPKAVDQLLGLLTDESEFVRNNAILSLGEIMDKRALEPLINALKNTDLSTRFYSIRALGKIGDKRAVEPLAKFLKPEIEADFTEEELVTEAITALTIIGDPEAIPYLSQFLVTLMQTPLIKMEYGSFGMDPLFQKYAFKTVEGLENLRAAEPLIKMLNKGHVDIRCRIIDALGKIGDKSAVPFIIDTISKQRDFWLMHNAILSFEKLGDPSAIEILNKILSEPDQIMWATYSLHKSATQAIKRITEIKYD